MQRDVSTADNTAKKLRKKVSGRPFKPGAEWRGNAGGRPPGARNRYSEDYIADFHDVWRTHGKKAIKQLATKRPADFVRIGAIILTKHGDFNQDEKVAGGFLEVIRYLGRAAQSRD